MLQIQRLYVERPMECGTVGDPKHRRARERKKMMEKLNKQQL
jgi:hypothetical protein